MNTLPFRSRPRVLGAAVRSVAVCGVMIPVVSLFLGAFLMPSPSWAGESIQVGNQQGRTDPTAKSKLATEKASFGRITPLDNLPAGTESNRRDPVRDRKARNAADERANWMVLDRGELDAKDEEKRAFGIRDATIEKESDKRDYFFTPRNEKDGLGKSPFIKGTDRDRAEDAVKESTVTDKKPEDTSESRKAPVLDKNGKPLGEHAAKELDLRDMLTAGKPNSLVQAADRASAVWKDVFGSGGEGEPVRRRDELTTADSYRGNAASSPTRSSDTYNFRGETPRPDLNSRPSLAPSGLGQSAMRNFSVAAPPVAPRISDPALSRGPALYNNPVANDPYNSAANPANDPYAAYRAQSQRSSSSGLQIPSRPGYGGR